MAWRATSLKAMFWAVSFGVEAITMQWRRRLGYMMDQASACMPPSEPPITQANCSMPRRSARRAWAATQSSTVTTGKAAPYGLPVAGLACMGPVEPKQEPRLLTPMTKKRLVSRGLPGPTILSHQPTFLGSSAYTPATWWEAFRAWQTSTALDLSALSSP